MGELTAFDTSLPAHIAAAFAPDANNDLTQGVNQSFPILSYKGKVWHVCEGDSRALVAGDDDEPAMSIEVVILKANPYIGKTYYKDGYEEGSSEKPDCYSNDSIAPADDSVAKQAKKCGICPHNQFGSKITENGARGKACSDFRRLAVAPAGDLERAMLLRVPAASLKELVSYAEGLKKRSAPYQALVTKVGFDHTVAYPKLSFKAIRWLDEADVNVVKDMVERDIVGSITALNAIAAAPPVEDDDDDELGPAPAHVAPVEVVAVVEKAAKPKAAKAQVTAAEVEAIVPAAPAAEPTVVKATGFGAAKTKMAPAPVAEAAPAVEAPKVQVLMEGAMAGLDAALNAFDDADAE